MPLLIISFGAVLPNCSSQTRVSSIMGNNVPLIKSREQHVREFSRSS